MKLFKNILLIVLGVALLAVLLVGLTLLSWWMTWPLFTGVVLLLGVTALVLVFFGLRVFLRWYNKKQFVSTVLKEQTKHQSVVDTNDSANPLESAWNTGLLVLSHSPLRFKTRIAQAFPWRLALDATNDAGEITPLCHSEDRYQADNVPLRWYFLPSSTIVQTSASTSDDTWEQVLTLALREQKKYPLQGVILQVSVTSLMEGPKKNLHALHC